MAGRGGSVVTFVQLAAKCVGNHNQLSLPFLINSEENLDYLREGIYDILASRITLEGRIDVIDRSIVERALYGESLRLT
jgi:hypothetical protein